MTDLNPNDALKQSGNEQSKPDTRPRIIRKCPRINAPMPIATPFEERIARESRRLVKWYGRGT